MHRHPDSGKFVAEHQREIAAHLEHEAELQEIQGLTAKLLRERTAAKNKADGLRRAAQIVADTVLPPRHPDWDWVKEADPLSMPRRTMEPETSAPRICTHPANRSDREAVRQLLTRHGGRFHGPKVEHLSMEEEAFWRFIDDVAQLARQTR